jgi:hypothetical protein
MAVTPEQVIRGSCIPGAPMWRGLGAGLRLAQQHVRVVRGLRAEPHSDPALPCLPADPEVGGRRDRCATRPIDFDEAVPIILQCG